MHYIDLKQGNLEYYVLYSGEVELVLAPSALRNADPEDVLGACAFVTQQEQALHLILAGLDHGPWGGYQGLTEEMLTRLRYLNVPAELEGLRQQAIENLAGVLIAERSSPRNKNKATASGVVYLVHREDYHKIGITTDIEQRMVALCNQTPFETELVCTIETDDMRNLERELHGRFADKRKNGEWFELEKEDVEYIKELAG